MAMLNNQMVINKCFQDVSQIFSRYLGTDTGINIWKRNNIPVVRWWVPDIFQVPNLSIWGFLCRFFGWHEAWKKKLGIENPHQFINNTQSNLVNCNQLFATLVEMVLSIGNNARMFLFQSND